MKLTIGGEKYEVDKEVAEAFEGMSKAAADSVATIADLQGQVEKLKAAKPGAKAGLPVETVRKAILTERNKHTSFGMHEALDGILRSLNLL